MKKVLVVLTCALVALGASGSAFALPPFKIEFMEIYGKPDTPLGKTIKAEIDKSPIDPDTGKHEFEGACFLCHKAEGKKLRNEYGEALSKYMKKADFKKEIIDENPAKAKAAIIEGLKKAEADKNSKGESYGDLIKAGKLPGGAANQ